MVNIDDVVIALAKAQKDNALLRERLETIFQYSRSCKAGGLPMEHGRVFALAKLEVKGE